MSLGRFKFLATFLLLSSLPACGTEDHQEPDTDAGANDLTDAGADDLTAACASLPNLPFCNPEPRPGMAKFTVGGAASVRWSGTVGCRQIDFRTGEYGEDNLTKAEGEIRSTCNNEEVRFEFVYRKLTKGVGGSWKTAFRPLSAEAAEELLRSCSSDPAPEPSAVMGSWWEANNTYAENLILDYTAPTAFATRLLPFDDDGYKKVGEEVVRGVETIMFRRDDSNTTVWMTTDGEERPLRVVDDWGEGKNDVRFTEWGASFAANIPADMRPLSAICETN